MTVIVAREKVQYKGEHVLSLFYTKAFIAELGVKRYFTDLPRAEGSVKN
jgi:hypothetical protein